MPVTHTCFKAKDANSQQPGDLKSSAFSLYVAKPTETHVGQRMEVQITAVNISERPQDVRFDPTVLALYMKQNDKLVPHSARQRVLLGEFEDGDLPTYSGPIVTAPVQPGATVSRTFDLTNYFEISQAGTYELCALFPQAHLAVSRTITLTSSQ